jgi:hypothetical protein
MIVAIAIIVRITRMVILRVGRGKMMEFPVRQALAHMLHHALTTTTEPPGKKHTIVSGPGRRKTRNE